MSQNNTIRKSDKKFIRTEKARIRATFLDSKKQQELIDALYQRFLPKSEAKEVTAKKEESPKKVEVKKEEKPKAKKEKVVKKSK